MKAFLIRLRPNGRNKSRLFVRVSTAVAKKAVQRNLLKRRVKGVISRNLVHLPAGKDFVIQVLPSAASLNKKEFESALIKELSHG